MNDKSETFDTKVDEAAENASKNNSAEEKYDEYIYQVLTTLPELYGVIEFARIPELFTALGREQFFNVCNILGGAIFKIPCVDDIVTAMNSLQAFHKVVIEKTQSEDQISENLKPFVHKLMRSYEASQAQAEKVDSTEND